MKKRRGATATPKAVIIKIGATYRVSTGILVVAEDFEVGPGGRTGRVIVRGVDGVLRFPRRWLCWAHELAEIPEHSVAQLGPASGGGSHP